ncbi:uncharacterized protein [Musca autumnalis]|uniref:uncharacterized protein n=1 Tax=Musca autumnalis TaxID=221902 RepID=UPI003CEC8894
MNNQKSHLPNIVIDLTNIREAAEPTSSNAKQTQRNTKNENADDDVILVSTTLPTIDLSESTSRAKVQRKLCKRSYRPRTSLICPICLESCIKERPTSTRCGHVFCEKCIKQSVRLQANCPICKMKINDSDLIRIYVDCTATTAL